MKDIKRKTLSNALIQALGAGVALTVAATSVNAQQAQRVEKIEVTGTNIKRVDQETVAPVEIITREQIERSGLPTVAEVLRNIPANSGSSFNETSVNSFAPGTTGISLRGLGASTTLVLLNGRRTAGYGFAQGLQDSFVDLNSIPTSAVERIEILKDGASAVYGSDAIAGVVNIILRKDFKGMEARAVAAYYEGKTNEMRASLAGGFGDLARDRWAVFGTFDFFKRDLLLLKDTEHGRTRDFRDQAGGRNHQSLTGGGTWRQLTAANALTPNQRAITDCAAYGGFVTTGPQAASLGLISPQLGNTAFNIPGNTFCSYDFNSQFTALPKQERYGFLGRATREFSSNLTGYIELGLSKVETFQTFQNPFFAGTSGFVQTSVGLRPFVYNINFAPGVAGNPFASNARYVGVHADLGRRDANITSDTLRVLGGLQYTWRTWDFDSAIGFSKNEIEQRNKVALLSGTSAVFGVPTTVQPPIPLSTVSTFNLDRPSLNSDAVRNQIKYTSGRNADSELKFVDTKSSTEFGRLPGGPIGLAIGAEYREEKLQDRPDPKGLSGDILGLGLTATDGSRDSTAVYAEVALPITRAVEVQVAGRHDRYSDYGTSTTPKVGIKIKPISSILLRANWGKGFRAPSLPEISPSVATFFTSVTDPTTNAVVQVSGVFAGNPTLNPEKSESATAGIIFEPNQNFSVGLNYYRIEWKDQVASPSFQSIVNSGDPTRVIRDPATGVLVSVFSNYTNLSETYTDGLDLEVRYRMSTAMGRWTARGNFSYIDSYEENGYKACAGTNFCTPNLPRTRGSVSVDWDHRALAVTAQVNYISSMYHQFLAASFRTPPTDPNFQNGVFPDRIRTHVTFDLFGRYTLTRNLSISGSLVNVNDKKPPYDPGFGTTLYDNSTYDVRGRRIALGLTWKM